MDAVGKRARRAARQAASAAMRAKLGNPMPEGVNFTAGLYRVIAN